MIKLKILSVGKNKEAWLDLAIEEYIKRLSQIIQFEFVWAKNDEELVALVKKEPMAICLDAAGKPMTSEHFADFLHAKVQEAHSRLAFVIGGAEGLPPALKQYPLMSLSPLTFTHQMARIILIEQIYRAFEIAKGTKYHK
jgi:23S rRNA (pseudouridine1915-N3)-methyltransferase